VPDGRAGASAEGTHRVAMAAHIWLRNEAGELLVIRRTGTTYLGGFWSVPAGHVEADETATQACVREVSEEVGVRLAIDDLRFALVQQKTGRDGEERVDFFFEASLPPRQQARIASPREVGDMAWVRPTCLPEPFAPYVRAAMEARRASAALSTWGFD
jgi:8-oxo-dGTP diphosphatase